MIHNVAHLSPPLHFLPPSPPLLSPSSQAHYSTGRVAQALTSTVAVPETVNVAGMLVQQATTTAPPPAPPLPLLITAALSSCTAVVDRDVLRYQAVKKKGEADLCSPEVCAREWRALCGEHFCNLTG